MNTKPISIFDIDVSRITFKYAPGKAGRGPSINLMYDGSPLVIRFPKLKSPHGYSKFQDKSGKENHNIAVSLEGCDSYAMKRAEGDSDAEFVYNFMLDLSELLKAEATSNGLKWFGKIKSRAVNEENFMPFLKVSSDKDQSNSNVKIPNGKYPPLVSFKIPTWEGKVTMKSVIDDKKNDMYVTIESLPKVFPKFTESKLVGMPYVYVMNQSSFGISWRAVAAQVFPTNQLSTSDLFGDDDEEEAPVNIDKSDFDSPKNKPLAVEIPETPQVEENDEPPPPPAPRKRRAVEKL